MKGDRPLRLFVAAYPPPQVAIELLAQLDALQLKGLKLSPPEQLHLTLQFIGDTDPRQLDEVFESIRRAASGLQPATVTFTNLFSLPERGRARLVAAALAPHSTLLELHRRLALRLAKNAKQRAGDHFLPHMTLGRYASGSGDRVESPILNQPQVAITQIVLVHSILKPSGAVHKPLLTVTLM